jgi:hypothetical protein
VPNFKFNEKDPSDCLGLSWNSDLLNLSLKIKINGSVDLMDGFEKFNIEKNYPTFIYRNMTIVKNNKLITDILKFTCSEDTHQILLKLNLLDNLDYSENKIYSLNLKNLNKINIIEDFLNLDVFSKKVIELNKREADLKVLKEKILKTNTNEENELCAYLLSKGVTKNGYNVKKELNGEDEFIEVIEFNSSIKGISSLPKISDVIKKLADNKKITPREKIIADSLNYYSFLSESENYKKLNLEIEKTKKYISDIEKYINKNKIYLIDHNLWFNNINSEKKCIDYNYEEFIISIEISQKQIKK